MESTLANIPYMVSVGNHEIGVIGALKLAIGCVEGLWGRARGQRKLVGKVSWDEGVRGENLNQPIALKKKNSPIRYIHRFQLPGTHSTTTDLENLFYSWDYANIHFVALDTESIIDTTSFTKFVFFFFGVWFFFGHAVFFLRSRVKNF
jgi:hypothetical protein